MMATLTEDALAQTVDPMSLQPGEDVMVVTKMGSPVSSGTVQAVYGYGAVHLKEITDPRSSTGSRIYDTDLYSFILIKGDETTIDFAETANAASMAEEGEGDEPTPENPEPEKKQGPAPPKPKEEKPTKGAMKEAQIERIMAAVSEAAMQSMRSSGVSHTEIYKRVVALQKVILPVLKSPEV